jgi:hypothetical protein
METKIESITRKQKMEEQLFDIYAEQKQINRYHFTELTCPYDAAMNSGGTKCIAEIKVRQDKDINFFNTFGPFLELKKIEGMWAEKQKLEAKYGFEVDMYYFNFAKDGLQIFKLDAPHKYKFYWSELPKDNYEPHIKVWKMVTDLKAPIEIIKK